jgi:hypothetical protein
MAEPNGITWLDNSFVVGTRSDLAPTPLPEQIFTHQCGHCGAKTLTETEYPVDISVICNVCAAAMTTQLDKDSSTQLLFTMSNDVKARLIEVAHNRRLPVEEVFKDFLAWKLRQPVTVTLSTKPGKKAKE